MESWGAQACWHVLLHLLLEMGHQGISLSHTLLERQSLHVGVGSVWGWPLKTQSCSKSPLWLISLQAPILCSFLLRAFVHQYQSGHQVWVPVFFFSAPASLSSEKTGQAMGPGAEPTEQFRASCWFPVVGPVFSEPFRRFKSSVVCRSALLLTEHFKMSTCATLEHNIDPTFTDWSQFHQVADWPGASVPGSAPRFVHYPGNFRNEAWLYWIWAMGKICTGSSTSLTEGFSRNQVGF